MTGIFEMAGNQDNFDRGPPVTNNGCQLQAVDAAWHIDISEDNSYVCACLKDIDRLRSICRSKRCVSCGFNQIHGGKA
ncbi:hypothetical protein D3C80_1980400 [compost metagenome]